MSDQRDRDREAYYRAAERQDGAYLETQLDARTQSYMQATLDRAVREGSRVSVYQPESPQEQHAYMQRIYGAQMPHGVGVRQGEYITLGADEVTEATRFIATDFMLDCHTLVLVARDREGAVMRTLLTHVDAMTNIAAEIPKLVARMPQGGQIEATMLGSPYAFNYYLQSDLMDALMDERRIDRIRYNFDAATTVAVDTMTGHVLTATPRETTDTRAMIEPAEIPATIVFSPVGPQYAPSYRALLKQAFSTGRALSSLTLDEAYRLPEGFISSHDGFERFVLERAPDGLAPEELRTMTDHLADTLQQPVRIEPLPDDAYGRVRFAVRSENGGDLGNFTLPAVAAAASPTDIAQAASGEPRSR